MERGFLRSGHFGIHGNVKIAGIRGAEESHDRLDLFRHKNHNGNAFMITVFICNKSTDRTRGRIYFCKSHRGLFVAVTYLIGVFAKRVFKIFKDVFQNVSSRYLLSDFKSRILRKRMVVFVIIRVC